LDAAQDRRGEFECFKSHGRRTAQAVGGWL
jgi:hypothetical protein